MMISTIAILGLAGEPIPDYPEFRIVNLESREAFNETSFFSKIPVMYWDRSSSNPFLSIPSGHFVAIFGRLEQHPDLGLYVLAEQVRHFPSNLKIHQQKEENK